VPAPTPSPPRATLPAEDVLPAVPDLPAKQRAVQVVGGSERRVGVGAAHARGLTVVDLSDAWAPSVIDDHAGPKGATLVNPRSGPLWDRPALVLLILNEERKLTIQRS